MWHRIANTIPKSDRLIQRILVFFEQKSFGVCAYIAEKFDVSLSKIRLFFIYSSFLAVGFPIIFYLLAGIVLDVRNFVKKIRHQVWDI
jgi:phage shock protein C